MMFYTVEMAVNNWHYNFQMHDTFSAEHWYDRYSLLYS